MGARQSLSRAEAEAQLRAPLTPAALLETLQRLPDDVDPALAADAALSLVRDGRYHSTWLFARRGRQLPGPVIRAVLERLASTQRRHAYALFLLEAIPHEATGGELQASWTSALDALLALQTTYAWGSKQRRAKLGALAASPRFLAAIQSAVVGSEDAMPDMLAVLASIGTAEAVDALLPRFVRAEQDRSELLDELERLKTHAAKTPAMEAMFASIDRHLQVRNDTSPALAFARALGFEVAAFSVRVSLTSTALNRSRVPVIQGGVTIDSTRPVWFSLNLSRVDSHFGGLSSGTSFNNEQAWSDGLGLGRCEPAELPAWLDRAAQRLGITWTTDPRPGGTLRGKKRDQFVKWLFTGEARTTE